MERATEIARKLVGADEKSVVPPQDGGDRASHKHFWAVLAISLAIIIFGFTMAFTGLFEL
ncbi:MAG: hypothetical protein IT334_01655 [Thermomicrobiales bacterium]|nr:hypothetical protein [Thermomicrobiales bacterium]